MSSKFLTFLTILVLFLSALGSSANPLKRQDSCSTITAAFTTTDTSTPGCTAIATPTFTAIYCGNCGSSGSSAAAPAPAQLLKRQDSSNCKTITTSVSTVDTSTPGCTATYMAPTATITECGTCP
ncbi:15407_t:CDS:1 [Gigaspora rosea]|nr:15407_t:CDS:1 [Gigaspora rosea]